MIMYRSCKKACESKWAMALYKTHRFAPNNKIISDSIAKFIILTLQLEIRVDSVRLSRLF